ncbi:MULTISPECIES: ArsR/SmtB family transcription factor [Sellimonas]|nr:transcriptional regulator [Drancourtella sp. An210]OUP63919.1 transcriptional regulator [Drancourtella sp. An177]
MSRRTECMETECCDCLELHGDCIKKVEENMPKEEILNDLAALFKVFGDPTRVKILYVLFQSELCVCDLAEVLNMSQSAISHQLRVLKQMKLVKNRRDGKTVFYSLADDHIQTIMNQGMEHVLE